MKKRNVYFIGVLTFLSLIQLLLVNAEETISLPTYTYRDHYFKMGNFDCYVWEFSASTDDILVLALTQRQYDAFYNIFLSEYTAILNKHSGLQDSGRWRPPSSRTWHFLYINRGYSTTSLTISDNVQINYYFPWIPLILGLIIGVPLLAVAIYFTLKKVNQRKESLIRPPEPSTKLPMPTPAIQSYQQSQQSTKFEFCPKCGTKVTIGKFCTNCGFDMSKL